MRWVSRTGIPWSTWGAAMAFNRYSGREAQAQQVAAAPVEASQPEAEVKQETGQE